MSENQNQQKPVEEIILEVMQHFQYRYQYQVAKFFNVTAQTLSGWIKSNSIPPKHLIKYKQEIEAAAPPVTDAENNREAFVMDSPRLVNGDGVVSPIRSIPRKKISISSIYSLFRDSLRTLIITPLLLTAIVAVYVFFLAPRVYTSSAKILPISKNPSSLAGFSGIANQFGLNVSASFGSEIQWDELYPDIARSENLMNILINKSFTTNKYPEEMTLLELLDAEYNYAAGERKTKEAIEDLKEMIMVQKGRLSPVVTISVEAFETQLAQDLAAAVIAESGNILLDLKTKQVREKRIFIEERIREVQLSLREAERVEEEFRLENKNIIQSPSLSMELARLAREVELQNTLYVTLKGQYENAKIEEVQGASMIQVIDGPIKPVRLTSPRMGVSLALALFFGFAFSIMFIYAREFIFET